MIWMQKRALGKLGCEKGEGGARRIYLRKETHDTKGEMQQRCDRSEREILENFFLQLVSYIVRSPIVEYCN